MAWSTPMTAVAFEVYTAAQFNQYVRDNLNETAPAKATGTGGVIVTDGLNSVVQRTPDSDYVSGSSNKTVTTYTDLGDGIPQPQVSITTGTKAIAMWRNYAFGTNAESEGLQMRASVEVTGASAIPASDDWCTLIRANAVNAAEAASAQHLFTGLNPGVNIFTMKYRISNDTGSREAEFGNRELIIFPL